MCRRIARATRTPGESVPPGHARIKAERLEALIPALTYAILRDAIAAGDGASRDSPALAATLATHAEAVRQADRAKALCASFGGADDLARTRAAQSRALEAAQQVEIARAEAANSSDAVRKIVHEVAMIDSLARSRAPSEPGSGTQRSTSQRGSPITGSRFDPNAAATSYVLVCRSS